MRIISGRFKGRALLSPPPSSSIRPTKDRVREALLNILVHGFDFNPLDKVIVDGFAGTGAFSFEMISRGARHAFMFDTARDAQKLIRDQRDHFDIQEQVTLYPYSVLKAPTAKAPADLIFLDPPYGEGLGEKALGALQKAGWISAKTLIVIEEATSAALHFEGFVVQDERVYGKTKVVFLRCT